jgi:PST family polysaccharide transporter
LSHPKPPWLRYLPACMRGRVEHRPNLIAILSNTGWLFADKILRMCVGLFVGAWIARYLGPEQFGLWNFAIAFVALFGTLANLGLDGIVIKELVKHPERQNELMGTAFVLKLVGAFVAFILAIVAISFMRTNETLTLWLVALAAAGFIFQSLNVIDFYFQANVNSKYTVYSANSAFILMTLVKVVLLISSAPLIAFAYVGLVEVALTSFFLVVAYRVNHQNMREWCYNSGTALELFKSSWPLMLSGFAIMIYMRIDQIMIGQMLGDEEVGLFSAAVKISEIWYFIPMAVASSVLPSLIGTKKQSEALYNLRLQKLFDLMVILALLLAIPLTLLSDWAVVFLFGETYRSASLVLAIHVWGGVFVFLGVASGQWFITENLQNLAFYRTLLGAILNVSANLILIPTFGITGAAVSTLLSQSGASYFFDLSNKKTRGMFWMKTKAIFMVHCFRDVK